MPYILGANLTNATIRQRDEQWARTNYMKKTEIRDPTDCHLKLTDGGRIVVHS